MFCSGFLWLPRRRSIKKAAATTAITTTAITISAQVGTGKLESLLVLFGVEPSGLVGTGEILLSGGGVAVVVGTGAGDIPVFFIGPRFWMRRL